MKNNEGIAGIVVKNNEGIAGIVVKNNEGIAKNTRKAARRQRKTWDNKK